MRSLILVFLTIGLLIGGFTAYWLVQPTAVPHPIESVAPTPMREGEGLGGVGPGRGVWANKFDQKTGKLASRFRADETLPQKDGRVRVVKPQAEFLLGQGEQSVLRGRGPDRHREHPQ